MLMLKEIMKVCGSDFNFREEDSIQIVDHYTTYRFKAGEYGALLLGGDLTPYSYKDVMNAEVAEISANGDKIEISIII